MPLRWPRELQAAGAQLHPLKLSICIGTDGRVYDTRVVDSAHPALDAQVLAHVQGWRFQPFQLDGRATPFCYKPRWDLRRPVHSSAD